MKQTILFLVTFFIFALGFGQQTIEYKYDNSGNRITRKTITLGKSLREEKDTIKLEEKIIEQIEGTSIVVYPNPVKYQVNIEITGSDETLDSSISLIDQGGRLLLIKSDVSSRNTFDLSRYSTGIYFLVIRLGNTTTRYTLIKN